MADYIKREDETGYIKKEDALDIVAHNCVNGEITLNRYYKIIDGIYDLPSADVAPVRHGRWVTKKIEDPSGIGYRVICSCCGGLSLIGKMALYCPNCGAKMDEERKDNGQE